MKTALRLALVVSFVAAASTARAQQPLKAADVAKFMGAWTLTLDSPQGSFAMNFNLSEKEGKLAGELTSDMMPAQAVDEISKSGEDLVLKYVGNFQGNAFDAKITLTADGDKAAKVLFDINNGQFSMNGTGAKK